MTEGATIEVALLVATLAPMRLPTLRPMPLVRTPAPLDDPAWIWELKLDGFRAVAYIEKKECRLISSNGHIFKRFD